MADPDADEKWAHLAIAINTQQTLQERRPHLTLREREVLQFYSVGWRQQNIAAALGISKQTVSKLVARARKRLELSSSSKGSADLVAAAYRLGLIR